MALIPARAGSKQIPGKNFKSLPDGTNCVKRAVFCALAAGVWKVRVTSDDARYGGNEGSFGALNLNDRTLCGILRPPELAQDDTPMIDVVKHALSVVPGPPEQIIVLLQPTAALRTPEHVKAAIDLLQSSGADSVVSVVELPALLHPHVQTVIDDDGYLWPWDDYMCFRNEDTGELEESWEYVPSRRQEIINEYLDRHVTYRRDGTVYAFWRKTVDTHGTMYGRAVRPLIIPAAESCELDTPEDWERLEARIRATMKKDPAVCVCETPTPHTRPSGAVICVNDCCGGLLVARPEPVARP